MTVTLILAFRPSKNRPPPASSRGAAVSSGSSLEAVAHADLEGPGREQHRTRLAEVDVGAGRIARAAVEAGIVAEVEDVDRVDVQRQLLPAEDLEILGQAQVEVPVGEGVRDDEVVPVRIAGIRPEDGPRPDVLEDVVGRAAAQG